MSDENVPRLIEELRRLVEQQRVWDDAFYGGAPCSTDRVPLGGTEPAASVPEHGAKEAALQALYETYSGCRRCGLGATRIKFVFGVGYPSAEVLFVGEGPGYEEDRKGEPFVGKAGQLLDKIIASIGLNRRNAYIANIVKCHPMQNPETPDMRGNDRAPNALEVQTCSPILLRQIAIIRPRFIVTLGAPSTRMILQTVEGITKLRGRFYPFPVSQHYPPADSASELFAGAAEGRPPGPEAAPLLPDARETLARLQVLPTYHPAAILRDPNLKRPVWEDMKLLRASLQST